MAADLYFDNLNEDYAVVTFHPVTMENDTSVIQIYELIKAMDQYKEMSYIITMANADAGGRAINGIWMEEEKKHSNWLVVSSLGALRYLSAVKYAKLVIGNSSSGIIEAPSLGTPTVNIGNRQKGRVMAESVINCEPECNSISCAIEKALNDYFQEKAGFIKSPFGDGTTSTQIVEILLCYLKNKRKENGKHFFDIDFSL